MLPSNSIDFRGFLKNKKDIKEGESVDFVKKAEKETKSVDLVIGCCEP